MAAEPEVLSWSDSPFGLLFAKPLTVLAGGR